MKDINGWLFLLLVFLSGGTYAQIKPVERGTKVPDIDLGYVLNDPGKHYRMSDLKGRMVILDFWFTRCSGCVAGFPKMRELQAKFGDKVMIFLVTYENKENVEKMIKKGLVDLSGMTVITGDTVLTKLFPPYSYPYHVWIDKEGIFRYGTFGFNTTDKNIKQFLAGEKLNIGELKYNTRNLQIHSLLDLYEKYPQFLDNYSIMLKGQYEYMLSGHLDFKKDSATGFPELFQAYGHSPLFLLQCAFSNDIYGYRPTFFSALDKGRLILEVKDSTTLFQPADDNLIGNWKKENELMYEVKIKPSNAHSLYERMKLELNNAFNIYGTIEQRPVRHLSLIRKDSIDRFKSLGSQAVGVTINRGIQLSNVPIGTMVYFLNETAFRGQKDRLPIVDNTGIGYNINLQLPPDDDEKLQFLRENGFDLIEKEDPIPMLVIRNRK